jgi:DNA-binding LacI/PurR family transcriptional regulator
MPQSPRRGRPPRPRPPAEFDRVRRPLSLVAQVELALRQAIAEDRFPDGKLPPLAALAGQLGVGRETVRVAAEALQHEGLLVKVRKRGTFTRPPLVAGQIQAVETKLLGYLQADFLVAPGQEEVANRGISGLMLQGALAEAGAAGFHLVAQHAPHTRWRQAARELYGGSRLRGLILASYCEDKLLRHLAARGLPTVLLDEDATVPHVHSVRDDSLDGARQAVLCLARLGHRRIAYAHWDRADMNRLRPLGYRQGLRDAGLPHRRRWEILTELTEPGARTLIDRFLALAPRPTALYCFNNTLAHFAVEELRRRGLRVPEDVSVLGAGGEDVPGLSCHQVDWYLMGRTAVRILLRALAATARPAAEHHLAPHALRLGRTTAAPEQPGRA